MVQITNYHRATSVADAYEMVTKGKNNCILGGCMWLKQSKKNIHTAVDISKLGLEYIKEEGEFIYIGAMATLSDVEHSSVLTTYYSSLFKDMTYHIVGTQFRNTATIGGSIFGRYSFSDILTGFLPLNGVVKTAKHGEILLEEFVSLPYEKDVLEYIKIPKIKTSCVYRSFRNQSTDFPIIAICVAKTGDSLDIAVGGRPGKAKLVHSKVEALALDFGSNMRGSQEYRCHLCEVLLEEMLGEV